MKISFVLQIPLLMPLNLVPVHMLHRIVAIKLQTVLLNAKQLAVNITAATVKLASLKMVLTVK